MASIRDLDDKLKDLFRPKSTSTIPQKQIRQPYKPKQSLMVKIGQSNFGKGLTNFQRDIEQQTLPKVNFTQYTDKLRDPTARTIAGVGAGMAQDFLNLPQRLYEGGGRIGTQIVRPIQEGKKIKIGQAIGATASAIEPIFDIATLGSGIAFKHAGKQGLKQAGKQTFKQSLKKGALVGAGYGTTFGGLRGLSEGREATLENFGQGAMGGLLLGGVLGGGTAGSAHLVQGAIRRVFPKATPRQVEELGRRYIQEDGKFKGSQKQTTINFPGGTQEKFYTGGNQPLPATKGVKITNWQDKVKEVLKDQRGFIRIGATVGKETPQGLAKSSSEGIIPPKVKVGQTFKTEKFNVNTKQEKALRNLQKTLGLDQRTVRSFDDMKVMAEELGTDPRKLMRDIDTNRITDAQVVALGNTISTSTQRIAKLTKQLQSDPTSKVAQAQLDAEEALINSAVRKRITGLTEAGRAIVSARIIANRTLDKAYWITKAQRQLGTKEVTPDVVTAINDFISKKDRLGLARFITTLGESSGLEKAIGLWKASLLTGFRTHEANIISNTAMSGFENIKDIPATGFDMVRSAITGGPRTKSIGFGSIPAQIRGVGEGAMNAKEVLKTGVDPRDIAKSELFKPLRFGDTVGGKIAQKVTNAVFRTLGAEDKVFFGAAFRKSLSEQFRVAKINGKTVTDPTEDMIALAIKDASYATFTNENALNNAIKGAKQAGGTKLAAALDVIMPFTRTPTNVAKATFIDYTPVGITKTVAQKLFNRQSVSDKELAEAFGRSVTGTAVLWLGAELAKRGLISGASSSKETERSQAELEGRPANSIFINGKWQSAGKISPLGNLIMLGAEYYNSGGNLAETALAGAKGFSENSFLKGLSGGIKAITEPDRYASSLVENTIAGYVPNLASDIARGLDTVRRDPEGLKERVMAKLPGVREALPAKLNAMGEPIVEQGRLAGAMFNPFNSTTPNDDPLINEFKSVGYNLNYVGDTISVDGIDTKLSRDDQRQYQKLAGQYIREYVPQVIGSEGYQNLAPDQKRDLIEKAVNKAKEVAREELKASLGGTKDYGIKADASANESTKSNFTYVQDGSVKTLSLDPIIEMPESNKYEKALKNSKAFSKIDDIVNSTLSDDQKGKALDIIGVSKEDAEYYSVANQENPLKTIFVEEQLQSLDHDGILNQLLEWRNPINGKAIAADGVLDNLVDDGLITKEEAKILKDIDFDSNGKMKVKSSGSGKKGTKLTLPKASAPKVTLGSFKKSKAPAVAKLSRGPVTSKIKKRRTLKIKAPQGKISYKIQGPSKTPMLTSAVKLV